MELHDLFPTPVARVPAVVDAATAARLARHLRQRVQPAPVANGRSTALVHSRPLAPGDDAAVDALAYALLAPVAAFGQALLGEALRWSIKDLWANVMQPGGHQSLHHHANSLVSGVVYLTGQHGAARTTFCRGLGGHDFKLAHQHVGVVPGRYNAERWQVPVAAAGDVLLFPSYLLHEVPPHEGDGERITVAFNAIPERLQCWGYGLGLSG